MAKSIKKKATAIDVAQLAGVSKATVSMALRGGTSKTTKVSEATRQRVEEAARALGYVPNDLARSLATQRTGFLGYLLSDTITDGFNNSFFNRYLAGVEEATRAHGCGLYTARATLSDIQQVVFPEKLRQRSVDGFLAIGTIPEEVFQEFERYSLPTIFLNRHVNAEYRYPTFCMDTLSGIRQAIEHGFQHGHRRIWHCAHPSLLERDYMQNVTKELQHDLAGCRLILQGVPDEKKGELNQAQELVDTYLKLPQSQRPTLICGDTKLMLLVLAKLNDLGICCPADISAIGYVDLEMCHYALPGLTTADYPLEKIGRDATERLLEAIGKGQATIPTTASQNNYEATIISRNSVKDLN